LQNPDGRRQRAGPFVRGDRRESSMLSSRCGSGPGAVNRADIKANRVFRASPLRYLMWRLDGLAATPRSVSCFLLRSAKAGGVGKKEGHIFLHLDHLDRRVLAERMRHFRNLGKKIFAMSTSPEAAPDRWPDGAKKPCYNMGGIPTNYINAEVGGPRSTATDQRDSSRLDGAREAACVVRARAQKPDSAPIRDRPRGVGSAAALALARRKLTHTASRRKKIAGGGIRRRQPGPLGPARIITRQLRRAAAARRTRKFLRGQHAAH